MEEDKQMANIYSARTPLLALAGILVLSLLLMACSGSQTSGQEASNGGNSEIVASATPLPTPVPTEPEAKRLDSGQDAQPQAQEPPATQGAAEAAMPDPTEPVLEEAGEERPAFKPSTRTGLEATNPAALNLASGEVQFVEFFAFW